MWSIMACLSGVADVNNKYGVVLQKSLNYAKLVLETSYSSAHTNLHVIESYITEYQ